MFADRKHRVISYHDTWISADPIRGCPYTCSYCVLRHSDGVGVRPTRVVSPQECVDQLKAYHFYAPTTPVALGNETDLFHAANVDYTVELLRELGQAKVENPIVLITKAPLSGRVLSVIADLTDLRIVFFLSYSGLGRRYEPNFTDEQLRNNFRVVKEYRFPIVHYWRPLLPANTHPEAIDAMLQFVSSVADASVLIGLKIHPELTLRLVSDGGIDVPDKLRGEYGEWLGEQVIPSIHDAANRLCADYPLYRHSSCALARVLRRVNHTATVFRQDICPPSHCPAGQRQICATGRRIADEEQIRDAIRALGRHVEFERYPDRVAIRSDVNQEEFAFLLHALNCPIEVERVEMQNLYHGSIYSGQILAPPNPPTHPERPEGDNPRVIPNDRK